MTVLVITTAIFYGSMQSIKLITFDDTDVMLSARDAFFDDTFIYSGNLMLAFAVSAYDSNPDPIEDPSIGQLKPYYKTWGLDDSNGGVQWEQLPTRNCTLAELHLRN